MRIPAAIHPFVLATILVATRPAAPARAAIVLGYCGYIGGAANDNGLGIAVDAAGNAYVSGSTASDETTFPVTVGPDLTFAGGSPTSPTDAFVAKVRADGAALVYAGYIGGIDWDDVDDHGVAVDLAGNAYVGGGTHSTEATFPVVVGPDLTIGRGVFGDVSGDAFVAKVSADGTSLVYAGYIGGGDEDDAKAIKVDAGGSAYLSGFTWSNEMTFPVKIGPDLTHNDPRGGIDVFVAKVHADGTSLDYAGYIGGQGAPDECSYALAIDPQGNAYPAGRAGMNVSNFPVVVGPDLTYNGGLFDAFVAKVSADGADLVYSGYIGGSDGDSAGGIAADGSGSVGVVGWAGSDATTFPVKVGPDLVLGGVEDAYIAKVLPDGSALAWAGYIGGDEQDGASGLALDPAGNLYVAGSTSSSEATFPVALGPDLTSNGSSDAFVAKVRGDGTGLIWAGFIGGDQGDIATDVGLDAAGHVYVTGVTPSPESTFPVLVGPDLTYNGQRDRFVEKIVETACLAQPSPVTGVKAVKASGALDDVVFEWQPDTAANGYNLWYVERKEDVPDAKQSTQPPALPVVGCATPVPASSTACTDTGAVPRGSPSVFFYQIKSFCDAANEGP